MSQSKTRLSRIFIFEVEKKNISTWTTIASTSRTICQVKKKLLNCFQQTQENRNTISSK